MKNDDAGKPILCLRFTSDEHRDPECTARLQHAHVTFKCGGLSVLHLIDAILTSQPHESSYTEGQWIVKHQCQRSSALHSFAVFVFTRGRLRLLYL